MQAVSLKDIEIHELKDIQNVEIHTELPKKERVMDVIGQIGNPYCYRHGDYVVKVSFADTDVTLEERIISYMRSEIL